MDVFGHFCTQSSYSVQEYGRFRPFLYTILLQYDHQSISKTGLFSDRIPGRPRQQLSSGGLLSRKTSLMGPLVGKV